MRKIAIRAIKEVASNYTAQKFFTDRPIIRIAMADKVRERLRVSRLLFLSRHSASIIVHEYTAPCYRFTTGEFDGYVFCVCVAQSFHAIVDIFLLRRIDLPDDFEAKIVQKVVKGQQVRTAENLRRLAYVVAVCVPMNDGNLACFIH